MPAERDGFATGAALVGRGPGRRRCATRKAWIPDTNAGMTNRWTSADRVRGLGMVGEYVKPSVNRWSRIAVAAVLTGALGLGACGRKGPLDLPPSAALPPAPAAAPAAGVADRYAPAPAIGAPGTAVAADAAPAAAAAPPPKKTFILDPLIGK